jgi:hypothetical protein
MQTEWLLQQQQKHPLYILEVRNTSFYKFGEMKGLLV